MKFVLLLLVFAFVVQSQLLGGYVTLSEDEINATPVINDLKNLGATYVIQKGVFVSTKAPLPYDWYKINSTEKVEAKVTSEVTYYKYTVILIASDFNVFANATYVVSWRPSNAAFLVVSYQYTVTVISTYFETYGGSPSLVDVRPLNNGTTDLFPILVDATKYVVHDAAEKGLLPGGVYALRYVYNSYKLYSYPPLSYVFLVRLESSSGINYRIQMTVPVLDEAHEPPEENHEAEYGNNENVEEDENSIGEILFGDGYTITYIIYPNA